MINEAYQAAVHAVAPFVDKVMNVEFFDKLGGVVDAFGGDFQGFLTELFVDLSPAMFDLGSFFESVSSLFGA